MMRVAYTCLTKYPLVIAVCVTTLLLTACGGKTIETEAKYPTGADRAATEGDIYADAPSIFGSDGLNIFGGTSSDDTAGGSIGVNSYLWRASLDTVSFMPLASADPFGGVILTDWYSAPDTPGERIKMNVFILDRQLRSDGIQVKVFKQTRRGGEWRDSAVSADTNRQIEDAILTRARQMRVARIGTIR